MSSRYINTDSQKSFTGVWKTAGVMVSPNEMTTYAKFPGGTDCSFTFILSIHTRNDKHF